MARVCWKAGLGSQVWPVGRILRKYFIWTPWPIKAARYWAPNWPRSQTWLLPSRAAVLCTNTFCGLFPHCSSTEMLLPSISLVSSPLTSFFLPTLLFIFIWGERAYEKRSSLLAEALMVLGIELWAVDPHTPGPKMRPPSRIVGCPQNCFPELNSWQGLPPRTQSIIAWKGISPLLLPPTLLPTPPARRAILTKFRKREFHLWTGIAERTKNFIAMNLLASPEVGSSLTPSPSLQAAAKKLKRDTGDGRDSFSILASTASRSLVWLADTQVYLCLRGFAVLNCGGFKCVGQWTPWSVTFPAHPKMLGQNNQLGERKEEVVY